MFRSWLNPEASRNGEENNQGSELLLDQFSVTFVTSNIVKEPSTFEEAWYCFPVE